VVVRALVSGHWSEGLVSDADSHGVVLAAVPMSVTGLLFDVS